MYCVRAVTKDLYWVGGNDRRLAMFEGVYSVPDGVSYNSYLLLDGKTVLFDTVDRAVSKEFFENIAHALQGRTAGLSIVHHMEPDHAATLGDLLLRYPGTTVVCNGKSATMLGQFHGQRPSAGHAGVSEGETLCAGRHTFSLSTRPWSTGRRS